MYLGNRLPLRETLPVYMYYLKNCSGLTNGKTQHISDLHRGNFTKIVQATNMVQLLTQKRKETNHNYRDYFVDKDFSSNLVINPNTREEAFKFIKDWIEDEVEEYIIIVDPYFKKESLQILQFLSAFSDDLEIDILSCGIPDKDIEKEFKAYWNHLTDERPPYTNIKFCGVENNKSEILIHDRWILTKNGGLRLGTSINSIGMKPSDALDITESTIKDFLTQRKRSVSNNRIIYKSFTL